MIESPCKISPSPSWAVLNSRRLTTNGEKPSKAQPKLRPSKGLITIGVTSIDPLPDTEGIMLRLALIMERIITIQTKESPLLTEKRPKLAFFLLRKMLSAFYLHFYFVLKNQRSIKKWCQTSCFLFRFIFLLLNEWCIWLVSLCSIYNFLLELETKTKIILDIICVILVYAFAYFSKLVWLFWREVKD